MRVEMEIDPRKFIGPCLLFIGWLILTIAVALLSSHAVRAAVVILGLLVELVGFVFFVRHRSHSAGEHN